MRILDTSGIYVFFQRGIAIGATLGLILCAESVQAKTSKYKRHTKTSTTATDSSATTDGSTAPGESTAATGTTPANGDQKVDLSNLENRYWTAKDTEFNVVQNRLYTKAHRFSLTPQVGTILNNEYTVSYNWGLALNYYFSERQGIELQGWKTTTSDADFVSSFGNQYGLIPDHNLPEGFVGLNYNWVPIYAKMSLLEKRILYFDMSLNPGIGVTFLQSDTFSKPPTFTAAPAVNQSPFTLALDVAQQVFINEHLAIRLDLRNHFYQENIYSAEFGNQVRNKFTYEASVLLGLTLFQ